MTIDEKLDEIIKRLDRIEQRQIKTTAMVEDVEKHEAIGSFGTTDEGTERKR